ncbi:hypothetical protein FXO37_21498 [Capsicum annuum]|nr:hypothetical protein FXO37_21498 [Capsicum annuum]
MTWGGDDWFAEEVRVQGGLMVMLERRWRAGSSSKGENKGRDGDRGGGEWWCGAGSSEDGWRDTRKGAVVTVISVLPEMELSPVVEAAVARGGVNGEWRDDTRAG